MPQTAPTDRPLRIAFITLNSGPHGEYGALLAAAVAAQPNVEVLSVVSRKLAQSERAKASLATHKTVEVPMGRGLSRLKGLWQALAALRAFRPDIVHEPAGSGDTAVLPLRPFLPLIAPLVVTEHNPIVHHGMSGAHHRPARALTRKTARLVHVHGPAALNDMQKLGLARDRLVLVRHGAFDEYGAPAAELGLVRGKEILVFGALRPNKGIEMLPEIFTRLRAHHPDATLLITGKRPRKILGQSADTLDAALDQLAQMDGVTVSDARVPEADVPQLFARAGACLLPYRSATQSGVAMIAMTTGAPLVATRVGDLPDVIEDGRTGLLADPTPEDIAAKLRQLFDDPQASQTRADAARRFAREDCAWPVIGAALCAAYRRLLAPPQR